VAKVCDWAGVMDGAGVTGMKAQGLTGLDIGIVVLGVAGSMATSGETSMAGPLLR
jgi:hypothetical protein